MERVTGLGGLFFKAEDPEGLYTWYERHLGLKRGADAAVTFRWRESANKGVEIDPHREEYEYGRFAWIMDPEGNRIELWEPLAGSLGT